MPCVGCYQHAGRNELSSASQSAMPHAEREHISALSRPLTSRHSVLNHLVEEVVRAAAMAAAHISRQISAGAAYRQISAEQPHLGDRRHDIEMPVKRCISIAFDEAATICSVQCWKHRYRLAKRRGRRQSCQAHHRRADGM